MEVYLIDVETKEIKQTFKNVERWSTNYVEYNNNGRAKIYCDTETEYFTSDLPIIADELNKELQEEIEEIE